jgi:hypothetical protein
MAATQALLTRGNERAGHLHPSLPIDIGQGSTVELAASEEPDAVVVLV